MVSRDDADEKAPTSKCHSVVTSGAFARPPQVLVGFGSPCRATMTRPTIKRVDEACT